MPRRLEAGNRRANFERVEGGVRSVEFHEAALEVARRAGICLKSARQRLRKRERGLLTDEQLYKPYMPGCPRECRRENQWGDLGLGPRRRLDDIQGSTALERAWNAADDAR